MIRNIIAITILVVFSSCASTHQASIKKHYKEEFGALKVYPAWKPIKQKKTANWLIPTIGLSAGAIYGYSTEFEYGNEIYKGSENAAIWAGIGYLGSAIIAGALVKKRRISKTFDVTQTEAWIRQYNKQTNENYVLHEIQPDNSIVIIPKHRLSDISRYEKALREKEVAQIQAQEERILNQQSDLRISRLKESNNQEKRRNIINHMNWHPTSRTGEEGIFSSAILMSMAYTGQNVSDSELMDQLSNYIGFHFDPEVYGGEVSYEISTSDEKFIQRTFGSTSITKYGGFFPNIKWKPDDLKNNFTNTPIKVNFALKDRSGNFSEKTLDLLVLSINEVLRYYNGKDIRKYSYSSSVNEQNPIIDIVLKHALEMNYVSAWAGYQDDVLKQIKAIWNSLSDRDIKYSSITAAGSQSSEKTSSQFIRFGQEALISKQANCVDGTVLFCSILERIGINAYIVLQPGHAYAAFDLSENGPSSERKFIEMTYLPKSRFESALARGEKNYKESELSTRQIISISDFRSKGVNTIGK